MWERQVWAYFLQAALAVQHLHHNRILHRWVASGRAGRQAGGRAGRRAGGQAGRQAGKGVTLLLMESQRRVLRCGINRFPGHAITCTSPHSCPGPSCWSARAGSPDCMPPPLPRRDLKPQNLMLARGGALLKVADLGVSAELARVFTDTQVGGWAGGRAGGWAGGHCRWAGICCVCGICGRWPCLWLMTVMQPLCISMSPPRLPGSKKGAPLCGDWLQVGTAPLHATTVS